MDGSVRLGGNIELFGVDKFDGATMIVLKKIIGTYARKFSEKGVDRLAVSFSEKEVKVEASSQGNALTSSALHSNVFFGVDSALKEIERQL
jgi:ribosome-associated translation inhibitor RaiA